MEPELFQMIVNNNDRLDMHAKIFTQMIDLLGSYGKHFDTLRNMIVLLEDRIKTLENVTVTRTSFLESSN